MKRPAPGRPHPDERIRRPPQRRSVGRSDRGSLRHGSGSDLVEARAAVDGSVVPRSERHDRLSSTGAADRCVELARAADSSGPLGGSPTRRTALRVVRQTLAGKERLLADREDELLRTVAAVERAILVHPEASLGADAWPSSTGLPGAWDPADARTETEVRALARSGSGPGLITARVRAESIPWTQEIFDRGPRTDRHVGPGARPHRNAGQSTRVRIARSSGGQGTPSMFDEPIVRPASAAYQIRLRPGPSREKRSSPPYWRLPGSAIQPPST